MSTESYFSERVRGTTPRVREELADGTQGALRALIDRRIEANWLAEEFPSMCPDGDGVMGTNRDALGADLQGVILTATWPLWQEPTTDDDLFDLLEYVGRRVAIPRETSYHQYFRHHELSFDKTAGKLRFAQDVNELLSRGGSVFEMAPSMNVRRRGAPETMQALAHLRPDTGDETLDRLIDAGRTLFASRDPQERQTDLSRVPWSPNIGLRPVDWSPDGEEQRLPARVP